MGESADFLYRIDLGLQYAAAQERAQFSLLPVEPWPTYSEISDAQQLADASATRRDLKAIDWTFDRHDTQFLTHDIHPYPAKFIPQIPGSLISRLSLRGELVLDPFGGSGTTALEAVRLGRRALSIDANPVATLIGRVKTCNLDRAATTDLHAIRSSLSSFSLEIPAAAKLCEIYSAFIPVIANVDKWFPLSSRGELAFIRSRIGQIESEKARDLANLALSKTVLGASFQDSETRYTSKPRDIPQGETIRRFLSGLDSLVRNVASTQPMLRYGVSEFVTADTKALRCGLRMPDSVDLVVTSPPYGNANDYHLYHRFRLLWLGFDPIGLGRVEIGSHLRHQKEASGFDAYISEMEQSIEGMLRVLKAGRYAVLIVGDAIYEGTTFLGAEALSKVARTVGFETICIIERTLPRTKRSFTVAGRRAMTEKLLVLRKPPHVVTIGLLPPPYKLWSYETVLRSREIQFLLNTTIRSPGSHSELSVKIDPYIAAKSSRLVFSHGVKWNGESVEPTWQGILENGFATQKSARKDPKYVTHGLHPYKGKFYPQLAKALLNLTHIAPGARVLDPFCGSGTTLLESYLNGHQAFGCDMHPVAARIAKAKVAILDADPNVFHEVVGTIASKLQAAPRVGSERDQFAEPCQDELQRWFPNPVLNKANWLLQTIRATSEGLIRDFLETVLSSIVREVSQQDPNDLRIRRRKTPIKDADVFGLFISALSAQCQRIERFWSVRGYSPAKFINARVVNGDARQRTTFEQLGLSSQSIDLVLTSPPYATALPYIDTDRLSLLMLFGLDSGARRPLEHGLSGSREITAAEKDRVLALLGSGASPLPKAVNAYLSDFADRISKADVGFRRENMPALLTRFFLDMDKALYNCVELMRPGAQAMIVIGDNRVRVRKEFERIPTTDLVAAIALRHGLKKLEQIDISVTTENYIHMKNAITQNVVLCFSKPQ